MTAWASALACRALGPGWRRDEAQQGGGGTVHRFGAGFHPVVPRGEWVLKRRVASAQAWPWARVAPASRPPLALLMAHGGRRSPGLLLRRRRLVRSDGGVGISSLRGTGGGGGRGERPWVPALPLSLDPSDSPAGPARPGFPWARAARKASSPGVGASHGQRGSFRLRDSYPPRWRRRLPASEVGGALRGLAQLRVGFCCGGGTRVGVQVTRSRDSHIGNCLAGRRRK